MPGADRYTLQSALIAADGRPSGFDYMRLLLAAFVVLMHSAITSYGLSADIYLWESPARPIMRAVLPMFFCLSGFLVAGSLERCKTLVMFLGLRIVRIYPALAVEVLLSAFLIGPLVTAVSLHDYFTDPKFFSYLLNVTGHIHFKLPGVFLTNPAPDTVNAQLWTVPYELYFYVLLGLVWLAGIKRYRVLGPLTTIALCAIHLGSRLYIHHGHYDHIVGAVPGPLLLAYAMCGLSIYSYRARIPAHPALAVAAALVGAVGLGLLPLGEYLAVLPLGYLTVYLGLRNPRRIALIRGADYSYGMYLYGFVIQQLFMEMIPGLRVWWLNILVCLPASAAFAALSWYIVEKPALRLKGGVAWVEVKWLTLKGRLPIPSLRELQFVRPSLED